MNPLDRINQLNDEVALLRSQLSDARKQLETDSATIAKLAKDKRELAGALQELLDCPTVVDSATCPNRDVSRIDEAPDWQAVLQISCAWTRYKKLKSALARKLLSSHA